MTSTSQRFLRLRQVLELFPVIKIGSRAVAWLLIDIERLIESLGDHSVEQH